MKLFEVKELDVRLSVPAAAVTVGPEELEPDYEAENMDSYWWELYRCLDYVGQEEFGDSLLPKFRFEEKHEDGTLFVGYAATQETDEDVAGPSFESMEHMSDRELQKAADDFKELQQMYPLEGLAADAAVYRNEQTAYVRLIYTTQEETERLWVDIYMTDYEATPYVFVFWGTAPSDRIRAEAVMDTVVLKSSDAG